MHEAKLKGTRFDLKPIEINGCNQRNRLLLLEGRVGQPKNQLDSSNLLESVSGPCREKPILCFGGMGFLKLMCPTNRFYSITK